MHAPTIAHISARGKSNEKSRPGEGAAYAVRALFLIPGLVWISTLSIGSLRMPPTDTLTDLSTKLPCASFATSTQ